MIDQRSAIMTNLDEITRIIVATVIDSDMPMMRVFTDSDMPMMRVFTLGQVVGALDADEATRFCSLVDAFVAGELEASVSDDGSMRLRAAQAKESP